jgi:hypothetical protein
MFRNKVTILITVGVLIAIAIGLQFINHQTKSVSEAIKGIPADAAIIIETENIGSMLKSFNESNLFRREFSDVASWKNFFNETEFLDSLINKDENAKQIVEGKKVIISGHLSANNELDFLYILPVNGKEMQSEIIQIFEKKAGKENIQKGDYEGFILYNSYNIENNQSFINFSFCFAKGLFLFSKSRICVEESIRMLNEGFSIMSDKNFKAARESSGKNVDANLYINYRILASALNTVLFTDLKKNEEKTRQNKKLIDFLASFGSWTELDFKMKNDAFVLSGYTLFSDSLTNYLNAFKSQKPLENDFIEALPENTSAFIAFNLSDYANWQEDYTEYLSKSDNFTAVNKYFEELKQKDYKNSDVKSIFYKNIEGAVTIAWLGANMSGSDPDVVGIIQLSEPEKMKKQILSFNKKDDEDNATVISSTNIDPKAGVVAYGFPEPHILQALFGDAFKPLSSKFYMIVDSKLIFASSIETLQIYYQKSKKGLSLAKDKDYIQYAKSISSESNIYIYCNIAGFGSALAQDLNNSNVEIYNKYTGKFNKIQAASIQLGMADKQMFTNVFINYNPQFSKKSKNVWEIALDTSFSMKPEIVKNFNTGGNDILIQDNAYRLILIDESGKILWKKPISGKILGNINQVDLYKNGKIQYMFNTSKQIYAVDRNGRDVEGFPVTFKSPATNGIAVFDYDKDRNYRLIVACENKKVYLLNASGNKVDGWSFNETLSEVTMPVQHFMNESKDYIVFCDKTKTYIVNRKGEMRIDVKSAFEKSAQSPLFFEKGNDKEGGRFVTTGKNGDVYFIFLDGQVKKMSFGDFSENHRFIYSDIDGDGKNYFIFSDKNKLTVFNRDRSERFSMKFDENIDNSMNLYKVGKNLKYIGVSPTGTNKIYLLDNKGNEVKGFPMQGEGKYSIAKLNNTKDSDGLNLIVGGSGKYLYNYSLVINAN